MEFVWDPAGGSLSPPLTREGSVDSSVCSDKGRGKDGTFKLNGVVAYVTWSKSTFHDKDAFYKALKTQLPEGTKIFGGKEFHKDGTPHYHVVIKLPYKVNWPDARNKFIIPGDTEAIHIQKPRPRQPIESFLRNTQAYSIKDEDLFGDRIPLKSAAHEDRKSKFVEIVEDSDYDTDKKVLVDEDP